MNQNQMGKYVKYAFGEILLVVIGILIALQINNWNEERKELQKENQIVAELYKEFDASKKYLETTSKLWNTRINACNDLMYYLQNKNQTLTFKTFDSLFPLVIGFGGFSPPKKKFNNILSSKEFRFKKSEELMNELIDLDKFFEAMKTQYQYSVDTWKDLMQPYLIENYDMELLNFSEKRIESDIYLKLIKDRKFKNIIANIEQDCRPFVHWMNFTSKKIDTIQTYLKNQYLIND